MRTIRQSWQRCLALPMLALALTACDKAPSAAPAPSAASSDVLTAYLTGMQNWVKCLRDKGVEVTDPDAKGRYELIGDPAKLKADSKVQAALAACESIRPIQPAGLFEPPKRTEQQIQWAKDFAKCLRERGFTNYPDPDANGEWGPHNRPDPDLPRPPRDVAERATQSCEPVLSGLPPR